MNLCKGQASNRAAWCLLRPLVGLLPFTPPWTQHTGGLFFGFGAASLVQRRKL